MNCFCLFVVEREGQQWRLSFWKWTFSDVHLEIQVELWEGSWTCKPGTQVWAGHIHSEVTVHLDPNLSGVNNNHFIPFTDIMDEFWKMHSKDRISLFSNRASAGSDVNGWGRNSWAGRIYFQGSFPLLSYALAERMTQLGMSTRIPTCNLSSMVVSG